MRHRGESVTAFMTASMTAVTASMTPVTAFMTPVTDVTASMTACMTGEPLRGSVRLPVLSDGQRAE